MGAMAKPKILLIGPIGDFGGREVEMNQIFHSLTDSYEVHLYSTGFTTSNSTAFQNIDRLHRGCLYSDIYKSSISLRLLAFVSHFKNGFKDNRHRFVNNKLAKQYFGFEKKMKAGLIAKIKEFDLIFICTQVTSKYLSLIIDTATDSGIPIGFRITGTIFYVPEELKDRIKLIQRYCYHSLLNKANLDVAFPRQSYSIIDQYAFLEEQLLKIPVGNTTVMTFGFLGRLSPEKGVDLLLDTFIATGDSLIIAGSGPMEDKVKQVSETYSHINFIGYVGENELINFFKTIDCLIICSSEEAGPLVGLEAMAAGTPIISTRVGAMMDRVENIKKISWMETYSAMALQHSITEIKELNASEITELGSTLREQYLKRYSKKKIQQEYLDFTNHILAQSDFQLS